MGAPGEHAHRLHHEHPDRGEERRFLEHLRVVRCCRTLLRRELEVAAEVRHVVLVSLDRVDSFLWKERDGARV